MHFLLICWQAGRLAVWPATNGDFMCHLSIVAPKKRKKNQLTSRSCQAELKREGGNYTKAFTICTTSPATKNKINLKYKVHLEINLLWLSANNKTYYFQIPDNGCIRTKGFECTCGQGLESPNPWTTVSRGCHVQCPKFQRQRGQSQPRPKAAAPGQGNCIGRIKKVKANWLSRPLCSGIYRQNILGDIRVEGCDCSTIPFGTMCAFHRQVVVKTSQSWRQSICFLGRAPKDFRLIVLTPALHRTCSFKNCWTPSR